jgi:hypothetical protein
MAKRKRPNGIGELLWGNDCLFGLRKDGAEVLSILDYIYGGGEALSSRKGAIRSAIDVIVWSYTFPGFRNLFPRGSSRGSRI